jgi:hypothetical protein
MLEDNVERLAEMGDALSTLADDVTIRGADNAAQFIECLPHELPLADIVSLDHDLGPSRVVNGQRIDPGDGRDVASALAARAPRCPVVIHSTNTPAAYTMADVLRAAGWQVGSVVPYGDLLWVREAWLPFVERSLSTWTR